MEKTRTSWLQTDNVYRLTVGNATNVEQLPVGVYNIELSKQGFFLERIADGFNFDYKLYGLEGDFIDRAIKAYQNTSGNMGILFNGVKGTGKTVTAKVIANKLGLPVIMAKAFSEDDNTAVMEYISSFNCDCVVFFDEFEKTFKENDSSLLKLMDGAFTSDYRRVFLLTTNSIHVNDNMLSRPSRIRYVKEFGNLAESVVREYLDDTLKDKTRMDEIVDFVDTLTISTIDILKSIVEDINIFGYDDFFAHKDIFNVKTANYCYWTMMYRFSQESSHGYDIEKFERDVKIIINTPKPNKWEMSDSQYEKAMAAYCRKMPGISTSNRDIDVKKSLKTFKIGDKFGRYDTEVIIELNLASHIVKTLDTDGNDVSYYYIKNPDAKPSLFSSYAYGYGPYGGSYNAGMGGDTKLYSAGNSSASLRVFSEEDNCPGEC